MAQVNKPDMTNSWASGGAIIAPSGSKVQQGWTAEIPPHQWENWVQNRQDQAITYLFQRGVAEWDGNTEYFAGLSIVLRNANLWIALQNNTATDPLTDPLVWKPLYTPTFTESEARALSVDIGPVIVKGWKDHWEYVNTTYYTGYRSINCGAFEWGTTNDPRPWQIEAEGIVVNESDQGQLIAFFREEGLTTTTWVAGEYKVMSLGSGDWRIPDLRNMFFRATGTDVDTANARLLGSTQSDAIQNLTGSAVLNRTNVTGFNGVFRNGETYSEAPAAGTSTSRQILFDASYVARTSSETRSRNTSFHPRLAL